MHFLVYLIRLLREFIGYAKTTRAWWIIPIVIILLLLSLIIIAVQASAPFIYTLF